MLEQERNEKKKELFNTVPYGLALTGRVRDWGKQPQGRLPVSCTVFDVQDSMEGKDGIEDSWLFTSHGLRNAAGVAINLSNLRPAGTQNELGLTASGPVSFMEFYSKMNEILRRGGIFKNGACNIYLDYTHPDIEAFIDANEFANAWVKQTVYVDEGIRNHPIKKKLAKAVDKGNIWLAKKIWDKNGDRLLFQVCTEVALKSRATCLISNENYGLLEPEDFPQAYREGAEWLCQLHAITGVGETGQYLSPEEDRQIGLGVIGLASFLAIQKVKYAEFVDALEEYEILTSGFREDIIKENEGNDYFIGGCSRPIYLVHKIALGFMEAAVVGRKYNMDRIFTVAPTATSFTKNFDRYGYAITPEISPPLGREIERTSETFGSQMFAFHPDVEIASEVGWDVQWRLLNGWQRLMDSTGLGHSISANIWDTCPVNEQFIDDFMDADIKTTYYRLSTLQQANDKSGYISDEALEKLGYLPSKEMDEVDDLFAGLFGETDPTPTPVQPVCNIGDGYCEACGGD